MYMRELRPAGIADLAQGIASLNRIARPYLQRADPQMAILGLPAALMIDDQAVAAFAIADEPPVRFRADQQVRHAVADGLDRSRGGGQHRDAALGGIANADVGPVM